MASNQKLFSVGDFDFRLQHLLVIGILGLSISLSVMMRATPASYGFELFEFDPFFNFRATEYIVNNGVDEYFNWIDEKSWHPFGRNISETSQVTLHLTSAFLYQIFGFGLSLYDFTILFPLIIAALTTLVVFAFVRVLGGTTAGLFAALIFSISVPIFTRGLIGWFKSEPLGIFFACVAMYLFVSGIKFNKGKISFIKLIFGGIFLSLGISAWGGILFFVIALAAFFIVLPFFNKEKNFLIWAIPVFSTSVILSSLLFERNAEFFIGYAGVALLLPTGFVILTEIIKKFSNETTKLRNSFFLLISITISGIGVVLSGIIPLPTFRYQNALNPLLVSQDALVDSVAEHTTVQLSLSFQLLSVFIVFALIGIWFIFSKNKFNLTNDMRVFILVVSFLAIYISSAFVRLELFASFAIIMLGSVGLSILLRNVFSTSKRFPIKILFSIVIISLFITPMIFPEKSNWTKWSDFPPTIYNGGSNFTKLSNEDWLETMNWLKIDTPKDSVVASWWDYGYWITTLGERTSLIDNSTLIDWQIKKMAYALTTTPENAWHILNSHYTDDVSKYMGEETILSFGGQLNDESNNQDCKPIFKAEAQKLGVAEESCNPIIRGMDADYILINVIGERIQYGDSFIYTLEGGGDESKKSWITKISGQIPSKFILSPQLLSSHRILYSDN